MSTRRLSSPPPPTERDQQLITLCTIYMVIQRTLRRNMSILRTLPLKMSELYLRDFGALDDTMREQLFSIREELRLRGIRMLKHQRTEGGVRVQYQCRGYQGELVVAWDDMQQELSSLFSFSPAPPQT
ncbi:hypothetical protein ACH6EH_18510 [Paenibacillus sp. JSM ZJ436]